MVQPKHLRLPVFAATLVVAVAIAAQPAAGQDGDKAVKDDLNAFALKNLTALESGGKGNIVWYPTVTQRSVGLMGLGASGTALNEFKALGFSGTGKDASVGKLLATAGNDKLKFTSASAVVVQPGVGVEPAFIKAGKDHYGTRTFVVPKDKPVERLNDWFRRNAGDPFKSIVTPDLLKGSSILILGAAQIEGVWESEFYKDKDTEADFKLADGKTVKTKFMTNFSEYPVTSTDAAEVALLKAQGKAHCLLLLPKEKKTVTDVVKGLTPKGVGTVLTELTADKAKKMGLVVPLLDLKTDVDLSASMQALGVKRAFSPAPKKGKEADPSFDRMTDQDVYVSHYRQTATLQFDHKGFRGGAAEVAKFTPRGGSATLTFDRPYVILVVNEHGLIILTAIVRNPAEAKS